uniref:glucose PTS transporter subunit IIA n=1 Tax=Streptococcus merionis TaxID=400065 RepID=UPI0026EB17EC
SPVFLTFMGLPVISMTYTSSVIPIIFACYLASKLQKLFDKVVPTVLKSLLVPFLVLSVTVPLTFLVVGPVTTWAGNIIGQGLSSLYALNPIIAGILIGGFWPVFIMFGLHWGFVPIALNNYATLGYDVIMMSGLTTPLATAGATLAIFLKTKNRKVKQLAFPAFASAVFGITEPAIYGVTLPRKKAFISTMIAVGVGGAVMGLFNTKVFINGGTGIFALPRFIDPENGITNSFIGFAIASAVAFVLAFSLTYLFAYKASEDEEITQEESVAVIDTNNLETTEITSPVTGTIISLSSVKDEAFAGELLGKGVGVTPSVGEVRAPENAIVSVLFPTNHAIGLILDNGVELLIHIGMDTVNLAGEAFKSFVSQGDKVYKGDLLIQFDIDKIIESGYFVDTPIVVTNTKDYLDVIESTSETVDFSSIILSVIK